MAEVWLDEDYKTYTFPVDGWVARAENNVWQKYRHYQKGVFWDISEKEVVYLIPQEEVLDYMELIARIGNLKSKLASTDYIIPKIQEAMIVAPDTVDALKERYSEELENRARWRKEINELQDRYGVIG